jgi:hypothetical protein
LASQDILNDVLSSFQKIVESEVSELIMLFALTHTGHESAQTNQKLFFEKWKNVKVPTTWTLDTFVAVMKKKKIDWSLVFANFDFKGLRLRDQKDLLIITSLYKKIFEVKIIYKNRNHFLLIISLESYGRIN